MLIQEQYMIQLGEFLQIISPVIYAGALVVSIFQFSSMRKNMLVQNMQQTYASTAQALFGTFNSNEYLEMSQESPIVSQYYSLAGSPRQYYIIIHTFDMFEYIFRLYKTKMIDAEQWLRWEATAKSMITIPKFKKVWDKTKDSRSHEFIKLIDSFVTS
jgi:hypothetical protein